MAVESSDSSGHQVQTEITALSDVLPIAMSGECGNSGVFTTLQEGMVSPSHHREKTPKFLSPLPAHPPGLPKEILPANEWTVTDSANELIDITTGQDDSQCHFGCGSDCQCYYPPHSMEDEHTYSLMRVPATTHSELIAPFCHSTEYMIAELSEKQLVVPEAASPACFGSTVSTSVTANYRGHAA